ncbi:MAG: hypothetical protein JEZ06_10185 [Anaerolineaceae bacterium]|nr:hypothetical protein [Anaerolineaceae bacterium]
MARFIYERKNKVKLSFRLVNNLVFLDVLLNDHTKKLNFLFDSSFEETILSRKTLDKIGWDELQVTRVRSEMGIVNQDIIENASIVFREFRSIHHQISVWDIDLGNDLSGRPVDGILGFDWLQNNVITLDYEKKLITFQKQQIFEPDLKSECVPIEIKDKKPYIPVKLNGYFQTSALVDTGSSGQLYLIEEEGLKGEIATVQIGKYIMQTPYSVTDLDENFLDEGSHILGGGVLKRFVVTFNYSEKKLYLNKILPSFWIDLLKRFRLISQ